MMKSNSRPSRLNCKRLRPRTCKGDGFQFSRAANQLRDDLRGLSPSIYPRDQQLRLEYFYNHFDGFYRAVWCYGIALVFLITAHPRKRRTALKASASHRDSRSRVSRERDRDALPDRRPAAGDEHV